MQEKAPRSTGLHVWSSVLFSRALSRGEERLAPNRWQPGDLVVCRRNVDGGQDLWLVVAEFL